MRTYFIFIFLLLASTINAQIKIDYDGVLTFSRYKISNHSQDIYYSWIREKENLSDENEIKYHFFRRYGDFSLYNLIVDIEEYESSLSHENPEYLLIKIKPGDTFSYYFPMLSEFIPRRIFIAKETDIERVIQSSIPKRLVYDRDAYFVIQQRYSIE
ncbi:MAG: hypothetical protein IKZ61_02940 [Prevotella sp.]|nr:hypothetical protein [Prevotella sp.]